MSHINWLDALRSYVARHQEGVSVETIHGDIGRSRGLELHQVLAGLEHLVKTGVVAVHSDGQYRLVVEVELKPAG